MGAIIVVQWQTSSKKGGDPLEDIRFLGVEGENLLLETEGGEQYRLVVDDALRRLIRKDPTSNESAEQISPRDIQIQIRSGVTVKELAEQTGASIDYIEKFAATVVDELQHVVASALAVRIQVPGDRFNEPVQSEFGEVISERLSKNRATNVQWSSRRDETGTWMVQCDFKTPAGQQSALWSFELRKLVLTPENDAAYQLQSQAPLTAKPVAPTPKTGLADDPLNATGVITPVVETPRQPAKPTAKPVSEPIKLVTPEPTTVDSDDSPATTSIEVENLATTTDLTDILRKRAAEVPSAVSKYDKKPLAPVTEIIATVVEDDVPATEPVEAVAPPKKEPKPKTDKTPLVDLDATQPIEPAPKKGRVPVQSWEEILLSTRSDDDQAN